MRAGRLRHRVTIQRRATGSPQQNADGSRADAWTDLVANLPAEIADLAGREFFAAQQHTAEVTTRIRIRHRADVTAAMRVVHGADVYNILAAQDPDGRRRELVLMCARGANDG